MAQTFAILAYHEMFLHLLCVQKTFLETCKCFFKKIIFTSYHYFTGDICRAPHATIMQGVSKMEFESLI